MALSGSGSAYYRGPSIPSAEGLHNADTIHVWVRSSVASGTSNYRGIAGYVGAGVLAQQPHEYLMWNHASSSYNKSRQHRRNDASYVPVQIVSTPATNTWEAWTSTFDGSNTRIYRNGSLEATSAATGPADNENVYPDLMALIKTDGTLDSSSQFIEGGVAEFALWNAALNADEVAALAKGFRPRLIRPASLKFYAPLVRELIDARGGRTLVKQAGTDTPIDHPRVFG